MDGNQWSGIYAWSQFNTHWTAPPISQIFAINLLFWHVSCINYRDLHIFDLQVLLAGLAPPSFFATLRAIHGVIVQLSSSMFVQSPYCSIHAALFTFPLVLEIKKLKKQGNNDLGLYISEDHLLDHNTANSCQGWRLLCQATPCRFLAKEASFSLGES